ncbi:hypothetical protein C0991_012275 [Blastosporella zonata]|nr:hypothetical protein C0991_012275 [Blastosporella zonata]
MVAPAINHPTSIALAILISIISAVELWYLPKMRDAASKEIINKHRKEVFDPSIVAIPKAWAQQGYKIYKDHPRHGKWMMDWCITEVRRYRPSEAVPNYYVVVKVGVYGGPSVFLKIYRTPYGILPGHVVAMDNWPIGGEEIERVDFELKSFCPDLVTLFVLLLQEISLKGGEEAQEQGEWYAKVLTRALDNIATNGVEDQTSDRAGSLGLNVAVSKVLKGYRSESARL